MRLSSAIGDRFCLRCSEFDVDFSVKYPDLIFYGYLQATFIILNIIIHINITETEYNHNMSMVAPAEYESIQAELRLLGATSAELMSQFYQIRYQEQQKEDSSSGRLLFFNVSHCDT